MVVSSTTLVLQTKNSMRDFSVMNPESLQKHSKHDTATGKPYRGLTLAKRTGGKT